MQRTITTPRLRRLANRNKGVGLRVALTVAAIIGSTLVSFATVLSLGF